MRRLLSWGIVACVIGVGTLLLVAEAQEAPPPAPSKSVEQAPADQPDVGSESEATAGVEVFNRGPIHEAFATAITKDPVRGVVITKEPPEAIDEIPPDQQPDGDNIVWVPGYWAFDDDSNDFIWVSGVWRDLPPSHVWVPGYWTSVDRGFVWVSGTWTAADVEEVSYLPEPPASEETGPSSPSPGEGYFWVPGSWVYVDSDYSWQPGYWAPHQRDWIWVPARYIYTPYGYIYSAGYWDYTIAYRGVAFAPVHFRTRATVSFTPVVALDSWQSLMVHLFVGPAYGWYYFGDYYAPQYADVGFVPFFEFHQHIGYDPVFVYSHWRFGDDFRNRLVGWHRYFHDHEDFRPRRTFREQRDFLERHRDNDFVGTMRLASNLDEVVNSDRLAFKFNRLEKEQRDRIRDRVRRLREFAADRIADSRDRIGDDSARDRDGRDDRDGRPRSPEKIAPDQDRPSPEKRPAKRDTDRQEPPDSPDKDVKRGSTRPEKGREEKRGEKKGDLEPREPTPPDKRDSEQPERPSLDKKDAEKNTPDLREPDSSDKRDANSIQRDPEAPGAEKQIPGRRDSLKRDDPRGADGNRDPDARRRDAKGTDSKPRSAYRVRDNDKLDPPRKSERPRVSTPGNPDKMKDIRPDDREGKSARVPSRRDGEANRKEIDRQLPDAPSASSRGPSDSKANRRKTDSTDLPRSGTTEGAKKSDSVPPKSPPPGSKKTGTDKRPSSSDGKTEGSNRSGSHEGARKRS